MTSDKLINAILNKSDIYLGDFNISKEDILKKYLKFLANSLVAKEHSVNFALHTGSICFDAISIIAVTLGCFSYNLSTNEDVISSLDIDDMILYPINKKKQPYDYQRYRWKGFKFDENSLSFIIEQDGTGRNGSYTRTIPYEENKHLIKPYYGDAQTTGARGIKKISKNNREEFLAYVFGVPINDIPPEIDVSIVIVSERNYFLEIINQISLRYNNKKIRLRDIVPISYFTNSDKEYQQGSNPTKTEPVLKITNCISVARDLVLDRHKNKVVGLLVLNGVSLLEKNFKELEDLLRRKILRFAYVTSPFKAGIVELILKLDEYENTSFFACTKKFLEKEKKSIYSTNVLSIQLHKQISNIINNTIVPSKISGGWQWSEYSKLRSLLFSIKQSNIQINHKEDFIIIAYGLLNLINTAVFPLNTMEKAIAERKINSLVISPRQRIDTLWKIAEQSSPLQNTLVLIVEEIEKKYKEYTNSNPKATALKKFLLQHKKSNITIVLPKAYYSNLLALLFPEIVEGNRVNYVTANKFNYNTEYDYVLVVGNINNNYFDPMQCMNTPKVIIFLYACEEKVFLYKKIKKNNFERALNKKIGLPMLSDEKIFKVQENEQIIEQHMQEISELDKYERQIKLFDVHKLASSNVFPGESSITSEVAYIGAFTTGEQILFSKFYSAVVFDISTKKVVEKKVENLVPGDVLVFLKRNDYTQNIVDFIYEKLLQMGRLGYESEEFYKKSLHWKKVLKRYKENGDYSYHEVAKNLSYFGCSLQEVTVRQWLIDGSHIVGPQSEKTMEYIARLTQDPYLLGNTHGYYEACNMVRHKRRQILELISKAIIEKLRGHTPEIGSELEIVYKNVENLSKILELSEVSQLEKIEKISISLVNKPITELEALI